MLGLPGGTVEVADYSAEWPRLFEEEAERIRGAVGEWILAIEHVGGTSIPGMAAKPILDIAVGVDDFDEAGACVDPLVALGYEYRGEHGIPRRHYFVRGEPRTHHIHMVEVTSPGWHETLAFRDYLIGHPDEAREYATLKHRLAVEHPTDRLAYQAGKEQLIRRIVERALGGAAAEDQGIVRRP